ncbi:MAG: hypothetical protein CMF71_00060 [Magnetovibrio sp.]|nr:hypothetical protein [Magnetovibrio sp.]|tara:strand:+ start:6292 stop:6516 length:225 start_codon:yes stop_codon:yes gene_type:complete
MPNIQIDGKDYDVDELSDEAKAQVASINFVDQELARLNARSAALQTARNTYGRALNEILGVDTEAEVVTGDDED